MRDPVWPAVLQICDKPGTTPKMYSTLVTVSLTLVHDNMHGVKWLHSQL